MDGDTSQVGETSVGGSKKFNILETITIVGQKHRTLNLARVLRGLVCLVIYLSTAFMMIVYWAPLATLLLRLFSIHYSRKATSFLFGTWLSMWPFLFENINKTKVFFSGESVSDERRVLLFANHRTEVDWMYLWNLASRKGHIGHIKYVLKSDLMKLPIFGWGFHIFEFISVERKWEIDESNMRKKLATFLDPRDSLWLAVFPEGTDYTEQKCLRSQQFAAEHGLPILKNVLLPKTRGFYACLDSLRDTLDAVYDLTIAYKHRCPTFVDNVFGVDPSEVHIHIDRFELSEIPSSESDATTWLMERFSQKDQLLSDFAASRHFPCEIEEGDLSVASGLLRFTFVASLTIIFIHLTLFSSFWFKIYVAFSCAYLSLVTHFGVLPKPVFGGSEKKLLSSQKKAS